MENMKQKHAQQEQPRITYSSESHESTGEGHLIGNNICFFKLLDILLKSPGKIYHEFDTKSRLEIFLILLEIATVCIILYGAIVGSFAGNHYYWKSPLKVMLCMIMSSLICIPSLYIFSCLNEIQARFTQVLGYFLMSISLSGVLLVGFSPVAWVFSQSTNSVLFMATIHLGFLFVSLYFGMKLLLGGLKKLAGKNTIHLALWILVFLMVIFQMTTSFRPIIGTSDRIFPVEKKFFLHYWAEIIDLNPKVECGNDNLSKSSPNKACR